MSRNTLEVVEIEQRVVLLLFPPFISFEREAKIQSDFVHALLYEKKQGLVPHFYTAE